MADVKRSNTVHTLPPSYEEHGDIELGGLPRGPDNIKFHNTGTTMRSHGGYQDYHRNAPHDPEHTLTCDDRLVVANKPSRRKSTIASWHLCALYAAIALLIALLALCAGMVVAKKWFVVRTELIINGAVVNDTTLFVSAISAMPSSASSELLHGPSTDTQTVVHIVFPTPSTSTQIVRITPPTSTSRLRVSVTTHYTITESPPAPLPVTTKTLPPVDPNDTDQTATEQDPSMTVVVVTPPASVVTSTALITTTLPTSQATPAATSTKEITRA